MMYVNLSDFEKSKKYLEEVIVKIELNFRATGRVYGVL